jgi:DNA-binding transcriptional MerR regulator
MSSVAKEPEYYKPAEACRIAEVAPYVLRYWETEFPVLSDGKEKGPARLYSSRDVKIIGRIRELLYDEGFTVAGAKKRLDSEIAEGRFDDGLSPAPPVAEQKKARSSSSSAAGPAAGAEAAAATRQTGGAAAAFPERRQVLRELKEIAKLLERSRKR